MKNIASEATATVSWYQHVFFSLTRVKNGMFVYVRSRVQVAKRPHFSRRWHKRSDVLLSPSRYNGVKFSKYLSGTD